MTTQQLSTVSSLGELPERWRSEIQAQLSQGENVVSALEVDLDQQLRFAKGVIIITATRMLARAPGQDQWQSWPFAEDLRLRHHDHAGVGHLELIGRDGRLAAWRFTLGQNLNAIRLVEQFAAHLDSHATGVPVVVEEKSICPSCKAPLEPDQEECPVCTKVIYTPPSTWTLFRLWRFARPYKFQLALGFSLMLLSTGAHMIPPYLTIPLMDNVLIPYQNGKAVDTSMVALYMSGLVGAAVMAWTLG